MHRSLETSWQAMTVLRRRSIDFSRNSHRFTSQPPTDFLVGRYATAPVRKYLHHIAAHMSEGVSSVSALRELVSVSWW